MTYSIRLAVIDHDPSLFDNPMKEIWVFDNVSTLEEAEMISNDIRLEYYLRTGIEPMLRIPAVGDKLDGDVEKDDVLAQRRWSQGYKLEGVS